MLQALFSFCLLTHPLFLSLQYLLLEYFILLSLTISLSASGSATDGKKLLRLESELIESRATSLVSDTKKIERQRSESLLFSRKHVPNVFLLD